MGRILVPGYRPDKLDYRDKIYRPSTDKVVAYSNHDLRSLLPQCDDQGNIGSCTSFATEILHRAERIIQKLPAFIGSHLFIYYGERVIEGTVNTDSGAEIRDGLKVIGSQGVPDEKIWPYLVKKYATKPSAAAYADAVKHEATSYLSVNQNRNDICAVLAEGRPVAIGFSAYASLESDEAEEYGFVPMPTTRQKSIGGHAVAIVGNGVFSQLDLPAKTVTYAKSQGCTEGYIVRNSWSPQWGFNGYFLVPYSYFETPKLASDLWKIETVNG